MDDANRMPCGKGRRDMKQFNRRIPDLEVARDKPSLQALVASPGWRQMSLSARVIAVTLLALARMDANNSVTIDRKGSVRSHGYHGSQLHWLRPIVTCRPSACSRSGAVTGRSTPSGQQFTG